MIKIYTALYAEDIPKSIKFDCICPENGKSPNEQIDWINENYHKNITVLTFSYFILNQLNVLIAGGELSAFSLSVKMCTSDDSGRRRSYSLYAVGEKGEPFIDLHDFNDIIEFQDRISRCLLAKQKNDEN